MMNNPFSDLEQFDAINFDIDLKEQAQDELRQKTIKWFLARWDKFTGSRIPDLMRSGRGKDEKWGLTAMGIIYEIAAYHQMSEEGREIYAVEQMYKDFRQTRWGNTYEPEARQKYAEKMGVEVYETGFTVHPTIPYFGGSFDGRTSEGIIEIKCPYDPIKHMKNRTMIIDASFDYYGQIQANIEVAGVGWCDFVSYDPRCRPEYQLSVIRVLRDEVYIATMLERIHEAKKLLDEILVR
jgi:hypothetical protein